MTEQTTSSATSASQPGSSDQRTVHGTVQGTVSAPVSSAIIHLMQGVLYRETDEDDWLTLERSHGTIRDHFATIGVDVVIDEVEGYAYLRSAPEQDGVPALPRLVRRRTLSYHVSVLLVLLRRRLAEFETTGGEGKLVLTTEQITEMMRVFFSESSNDARLVDRVDTTIKKVAELKFLRQLRGQSNEWEVRRIVKAYVDTQTLGDFDTKLADYARRGGEDE